MHSGNTRRNSVGGKSSSQVPLDQGFRKDTFGSSRPFHSDESFFLSHLLVKCINGSIGPLSKGGMGS